MINNNVKNKETEKISNYCFLKTIGKGTFGKVKLATHIPTNEKVAIKILEKTKIQTIKDFERIQKEIKYLKLFNHPNIIKIYEIVEDIGNIYIIMEYVSGGELFNYIVKNKKLDEHEASFFYSQIIHIIKEIHEYKICHRDIKPENLLLTSNKTLKIIDFGLSNEYNDFLKTPCGSPCYASPEVISGKKYSGMAIDLWASGIILYSMLCGFLPFDDRDSETLFSQILQCKINFPKNNNLSDDAKDLIKKILQQKPEKRITLEEILKHPFLKYGNKRYKEKVKTGIFKQDELIINYMINEMKIPNELELRKSIMNNKHNGYTTTFNLLKKKYIEGRLIYSYKKRKSPNICYSISPETTKNFIRSSRLLRKNVIPFQSKEIENNKLCKNSLVKEIGSMIKKKFGKSNNNIIIINNNDSSIHQPIKMNSLIHSLFIKNNNDRSIKNNRSANNSNPNVLLSNSVNYQNSESKINRKFNKSISIERSSQEKLRGFNTSRISDKLLENENIQIRSPIMSEFRLNTIIKGKHAMPKKYLNISLANDSLGFSNNTFNVSNKLQNNENYIINPKFKFKRRLITSINEGLEDNSENKNINHPNEYKKKIISGLYIKSITNLDNSRTKILRSSENSTDKSPKDSSINFTNKIKNINSFLNEPNNKKNNFYYNTDNNNNNINSGEENCNKKINYEYNENITNSETVPVNQRHFRKFNNIILSYKNKDINKIIHGKNETLPNKHSKISPNFRDHEENANISNKIVKIIPEKRQKIKVNKIKGLPFFIREKLNLNSISNNINIARTQKNILNQRKTVYINKKVKNSINYHKKKPTLTKKDDTEYLLASVKLTSLKICEIIRDFCREEGFLFIKDDLKFTIFLDIFKNNSFIAEIKINKEGGNHVIKLNHNTGDELKTKQVMKKLLFEIVK